MTHPATPATAAGRALQHDLRSHVEDSDHWDAYVLAIEAEVAARIFAALPAALRSLYTAHNYLGKRAEEDAAALVAAIREELEKG